MQFSELDDKMRVFETSHDHCVLPGIYMVARIDGRSFTRLTRDVMKFQAPFDEVFRDAMVGTVRHLMENTGFRVIYGYTQSDEISLLFHLDEDSFGRKLRKFDSILAGEASAFFTHHLKHPAAFDSRICQLPNAQLVVDYFRWRSEDAHRNALNGYCYWKLRESGLSARKATSQLKGMSVPAKNELLFTQFQLNFNDVPRWQKRGVGLYWKEYPKIGVDPRTGAESLTTRQRLQVDCELPMKDDYTFFVQERIENPTGEIRRPISAEERAYLPPDEGKAWIQFFVQKGWKVAALNLYRTQTGSSIAEARAYIESLMPDSKTPTQESNTP